MFKYAIVILGKRGKSKNMSIIGSFFNESYGFR